MSTRFLTYFAIAYVVLIGLVDFGILRVVESSLVAGLVTELEEEARLAQAGLPDDPDLYQVWADGVFDATGSRATLIDADGVVLAESHTDPATMENHADRPEVIEALAGQVGHAERQSASTGTVQHYVALPVEDGLIVRMSISENSIEDDFAPIRDAVIWLGVGAGVLGVLVVAFLANRLARPIAEITDQTAAIADGDRSVRPRRSSVRELDRLGLAISRLADDLGARLEEAEQANETLDVVLSAMAQGTVLIANDDSIPYHNPAAARLIGPVAEQLQELSPFPLQTVVAEARETGEVVIRDFDHGRPVRRIRVVATPFADDRRALLVLADITDRERAAMVRRDFVANASHELKTPVASIIAASEALRIAVGGDPESAVRFAEQIDASAYQLNRLVSDLLDLSRLEREESEMEEISLDRLVAESLDGVRIAAEQKGVSTHLESAPVRIIGSRRDLGIALRNVLDNAVRHSEEGDRIDVRLTTDDGQAVIEVADTGEGIPTRDLERIFERFYRVDAARARTSGGTGLGLSIVKHAVEVHGGYVEVESELGAGSTFRIRLPLPS